MDRVCVERKERRRGTRTGTEERREAALSLPPSPASRGTACCLPSKVAKAEFYPGSRRGSYHLLSLSGAMAFRGGRGGGRGGRAAAAHAVRAAEAAFTQERPRHLTDCYYFLNATCRNVSPAFSPAAGRAERGCISHDVARSVLYHARVAWFSATERRIHAVYDPFDFCV